MHTKGKQTQNSQCKCSWRINLYHDRTHVRTNTGGKACHDAISQRLWDDHEAYGEARYQVPQKALRIVAAQPRQARQTTVECLAVHAS